MHLVKDEIKRNKVAVIVEGELDMISSFQAGIKNIVAIKGSSLTEEQVRLLARFVEKIILALDSDVAGSMASKRGIAIAQKAGLDIKVADLAGYKDPDDLARSNPDMYKKNLGNAVGAWDFLLSLPFKNKDIMSGSDQAKISREVVSVLSVIPDKIVQAHYIERVAKKLNVPSSVVYEEVSGKKVEVGEPGGHVSSLESKPRRQLLEEEMIALMIRIDPKMITKVNTLDVVKSPLLIKIVNELIQFSKKEKDFDPKKFGDTIPGELFDGFSRLILIDFEGIEGDALPKHLDKLKHEIDVLNIKENLATIAQDIKKFEGANQKEELQDAQKQFSELSRQLNALKND
jgi:DNA primase